MSYSTEVLRRAQARLAQAKADRESKNLRHLMTAYEEVPRLKQIDKQLQESMVLAARSAFAAGEDGKAALAAVRQANLALQRERQALVEANFEPGYLDDSPICDRCGGSGYIGATMCQCLAELCRQERRKGLTHLNLGDERFELFRLDYYPDRLDPKLGVNIRRLMEKNFQTCRSYAAEFSAASGNLLFSGGTGLGKTFLSTCIAKTVSDRGYSVVYETAGSLFSKLERAKFGDDDDMRRETEKYTVCDLLIVDDLGTELGGQFTNSALYTIVNDRILSKKSTIISTNLTTEELEKRYSAAIASRLRGNYQRIVFVGEDIRLKKNWGL